MSATYCLLVGLSGVERIAVLDALGVPELAQNRRAIEPTDRLVIVARDVAAEARGTTATTWRRLGRKVDVIPPEVARTWRSGRHVEASRPAPRPRLPTVQALPYELVDGPWMRRVRPRKVPTPCAFCGEQVTGGREHTNGSEWTHASCLSGANRDLLMLQQAGRNGIRPSVSEWAKAWNQARVARLVAAGLMVAGDDGAFYRAPEPVTGG